MVKGKRRKRVQLASTWFHCTTQIHILHIQRNFFALIALVLYRAPINLSLEIQCQK